jgi:hypothetical protein
MVTLVSALPCDRLTDFASCKHIEQTITDPSEREEAILASVKNIEEWNSRARVSAPPTSVRAISDDIIKKAWIELVSIVPGIYEGTTLLSPGHGTVIAKAHYDVELPTESEPRDCKTEYEIEHRSFISLSLNGEGLGNSRTARFSTEEQHLNFRATYTIPYELKVRHYRLRKINDNFICLFYKKELRKKVLVVQDKINAVRHEPNITQELIIVNEYYGNKDLYPNITNQDWFSLQINKKGQYTEVNYQIQPYFSYEPYQIIQQRAIQNINREHKGIQVRDKILSVSSTTPCTITLGNYFTHKTTSCKIRRDLRPLTLRTNKKSYHEEEEIVVKVRSKDEVTITYAQNSTITNTSATFNANASYQLICGTTNFAKHCISIRVYHDNNFSIIIQLGLLFIVVRYLIKRVTK